MTPARPSRFRKDWRSDLFQTGSVGATSRSVGGLEVTLVVRWPSAVPRRGLDRPAGRARSAGPDCGEAVIAAVVALPRRVRTDPCRAPRPRHQLPPTRPVWRGRAREAARRGAPRAEDGRPRGCDPSGVPGRLARARRVTTARGDRPSLRAGGSWQIVRAVALDATSVSCSAALVGAAGLRVEAGAAGVSEARRRVRGGPRRSA